MRYTLLLLIVAIPQVVTADVTVSFQKNVKPVLETYCVDCHQGKRAKAGLDLSKSQPFDRAHSHHWFKVLERIAGDTMPPEDEGPMDAPDKAAVLSWIRGELTNQLIAEQRREGRSRFRRLSRTEYANTVEDLFGIRPPVVKVMPQDGRVDGYDKISKALPFSSAATEGHMKLAELMVNRMFELPKTNETYRLWARPSGQSKGHLLDLGDGWWASFNSDANSGQLGKGENKRGFPGPRKPGLHRLRMNVYGYQTDKPLPVGIYVGHIWAYPQILKLIKVVDVPPGKPSIVEAVVYLRTGKDSDGPSNDGIRLVPLGLGVPVPKNTLASERGKGKPALAIQWIDVEELQETYPGQHLLFEKLPPDVLTAIQTRKTLKTSRLPREDIQRALTECFRHIATRLFRRDVTDQEVAASVNSCMASVDANEPLKTAFVNEVAMMMTAPDFLAIMEEPGELTDTALASRLSYFLWNSTPDQELMDLARNGKLSDPKTLAAQTDRLLNDPKSDRFVGDFLDQWLGLWGIENTTPDKDLYPEYDDELKISSLMETKATFRKMLDENLTVRDFVAPNWALVNTRLADLYNFPNVDGFAIRKVDLPKNTPFGGIWTQASTMKVTANGTLTSPVKRGVWVAERLLGIKIPAPPTNVDPVDPDTRGARTLREQLALHSKDGSCKGCHAKFDPYGFALESFDVMGNYRTHYRTADDGSGSKQIFTSKVVTPQTPGHATAIKADIKGARQLWLVVDPVGDPGHDHAAWMEPRLVGPKGELKLTDLDWKHASQGWSVTRRNTSPAGTPMRVNGKTVPYGIGTHSPAVLGFDIPEGYETFIAQGGLDNSATDQKGGKVRFKVYTRRPRLADKLKWMDGLPVDSTGTTPDGRDFAGIHGLRKMLAENPEQLAKGVTHHLITYSTGEPASPIDNPTIDSIVKDAAKDSYGLRSLVHGVIQSELFQSK